MVGGRRSFQNGDGGQFDEIDWLASEICRVLRSKDGEGYAYETVLHDWMAQAGVTYEPRQFELAMGTLWRLGRLDSPPLQEQPWIRPADGKSRDFMEPEGRKTYFYEPRAPIQ